MNTLPQALTIATSDSGGGAGIQADIKTMQANGVYALSAVVALTAQNTKTVRMVHALPNDIIEAQIDTVFEDFDISGVKTGMLFSTETVKIVSNKIQSHKVKNLVVDPVMISKSGCVLLKPDAVDQIKQGLFPLASLVTPNIHEAERLAEMSIASMEDTREAARRIHGLGPGAVLIKGGHLKAHPATDVLYDGNAFTIFKGEFIDTPNTHGTGCTYSAAIVAYLARGKSLEDAIQSAKRYITEAIRHGLSIGHGHGPTHHFFHLPSDPF